MRDRPSARTGVVAGLLASLCCIGPVVAGLLVLLVGIDAVGGALAMETYRYPLTMIGLAFIGAYGVVAYRRQACCTTRRTAARKVLSTASVMAIVYFAATLVLLLLASWAVFQLVNRPHRASQPRRTPRIFAC